MSITNTIDMERTERMRNARAFHKKIIKNIHKKIIENVREMCRFYYMTTHLTHVLDVTINSFEISNYGPIKKVRCDEPGSILVLAGPNGVGKSTHRINGQWPKKFQLPNHTDKRFYHKRNFLPALSFCSG